jgi:hypothetical protein
LVSITLLGNWFAQKIMMFGSVTVKTYHTAFRGLSIWQGSLREQSGIEFRYQLTLSLNPYPPIWSIEVGITGVVAANNVGDKNWISQ